MKDRIRKARKALELTQRGFAERIGMKSNTIATYEMGRAVPSDAAINNICKEFSINETWLRTGEGEMFVPAPTSELEALAARYPNMTHETYVLVEKLINLPKASQDIITGFLREVVEGFGDISPRTSTKVTEAVSTATTLPDAADGDEEDYADLARQQRLLEKEQVTQASSVKESGAN